MPLPAHQAKKQSAVSITSPIHHSSITMYMPKDKRRARCKMLVLTCRWKRVSYKTCIKTPKKTSHRVEIKSPVLGLVQAAAMVICLPFIDFHCTNAAPTIDTVPQATET